ncbi:MAG: hypothetical protein AAFU85_24540 [Planctomycetota bacterium]
MKFANVLFGLGLLVIAVAGCSSSNETTVVEAPPEMTAEDEAAYEKESMGSLDDADQN